MKRDKNGNLPQAGLLGLGFDGDDGHDRRTRGDNFQIFGGSQSTHEKMQDSCIKFSEKLNKKGKRLEQLEKNELRDIAGECGMNIVIPDEGGDTRR